MMGRKFRYAVLGVIVLLLIGVACSGGADDSGNGDMEEMEHTEEEGAEHEEESEHTEEEGAEHEEEHEGEHEEGDEHEHEDEHQRIPNEGASIHIVEPESGVNTEGGELEVVVEIENFTLDDDGSHWHVYIDDVSYGMALGDTNSHVVRGIEPGEHELAVYLALGTHEELQEGDTIMVVVEE